MEGVGGGGKGLKISNLVGNNQAFQPLPASGRGLERGFSCPRTHVKSVGKSKLKARFIISSWLISFSNSSG